VVVDSLDGAGLITVKKRRLVAYIKQIQGINAENIRKSLCLICCDGAFSTRE
jgi:hypothetical protein